MCDETTVSIRRKVIIIVVVIFLFFFNARTSEKKHLRMSYNCFLPVAKDSNLTFYATELAYIKRPFSACENTDCCTGENERVGILWDRRHVFVRLQELPA